MRICRYSFCIITMNSKGQVVRFVFKAACAHSEEVILIKAVEEVMAQIRDDMQGTIPQAGLLFCSLDFDHSFILSQIRSVYPAMELIGCTTDGEMSSRLGFSEDSIVLMAFASDTVEIHAGVGRFLSDGGIEAGRKAATTANGKRNQNENRFAVMLSDPLNAGISEVSNGIGEVLGGTFPLIGGASAAHSKRRTTYQFYNDEILTDSVVLLLFSGPVRFSFGILGGHSAIGGKERITSSSKNVLYTIAHIPALEYFRGYIGDNYDLFMNYCLAIFEEGRDGFYVRSAPFCDPEKGTVTLNGVVAQGAYLQIGTADKAVCASTCEKSISIALDRFSGKKPAAALHISCAGRKKMLGTQAFLESQISKQYLKDIPTCGFYAYGEFCPLEPGGESLFHGTTFVTLLIGEEN